MSPYCPHCDHEWCICPIEVIEERFSSKGTEADPDFEDRTTCKCIMVRSKGAQALRDVDAERDKQLTKWGVQRHPDGTDAHLFGPHRDRLRLQADEAAADGRLTWADILSEEFAEALAEVDPKALREELVQVAAVACAWIEDIDRREGK